MSPYSLATVLVQSIIQAIMTPPSALSRLVVVLQVPVASHPSAAQLDALRGGAVAYLCRRLRIACCMLSGSEPEACCTMVLMVVAMAPAMPAVIVELGYNCHHQHSSRNLCHAERQHVAP